MYDFNNGEKEIDEIVLGFYIYSIIGYIRMCKEMTQNVNKPRNNYDSVDFDISRPCNKNIRYFQIAADVAKKSTMTQKHGCVIVHRKNVLSTGYNISSCNKPGVSLHAEVNAIIKIKHLANILPECDLYIVRIGQVSMGCPLKYSKPCSKCSDFIKENKIKKVYYSLNEPDITW